MKICRKQLKLLSFQNKQKVSQSSQIKAKWIADEIISAGLQKPLKTNVGLKSQHVKIFIMQDKMIFEIVISCNMLFKLCYFITVICFTNTNVIRSSIQQFKPRYCSREQLLKLMVSCCEQNRSTLLTGGTTSRTHRAKGEN